MIFTPKAPVQLLRDDRDDRRLLRAGLYDFHVARALEMTTRRGRPLLRLTLCIHQPGDDGAGYNGGGSTERLVDDCLLADDAERLWQFTRTVGLEGCYAQGILDPAQCEGQPGTCKIGIEPGQPDGRGGRHPDRNRVIFYVSDPAQVGVYCCPERSLALSTALLSRGADLPGAEDAIPF